MTKKPNKPRGFTLMEILVAIAMMTGAMVVVAEVFARVTKTQRLAIETQNIQESTRYALEAINKEIRTAVKADNECTTKFGTVSPTTKKVYNTKAAADELIIKNKNNLCTRYFINNYSLIVQRYVRGNATDYATITPSAIKASGLKFDIVDDGIGAFHEVQPKVTYRVNLKSTDNQLNSQEFKVQTTISSRHYE